MREPLTPPPWRVRPDGDWTILRISAGGAETTSSLTREQASELSADLTRASTPVAAAGEDEHPKEGHVYYLKEDRSPWSFVGRWKHPKHQPYHANWNGEYAIVQAYGNFKNELRFILLAEWDDKFELAWEPMRVCQFCGFTRMRPCLKRQTCANLTDYRLEPDEPSEHDELPA